MHIHIFMYMYTYGLTPLPPTPLHQYPVNRSEQDMRSQLGAWGWGLGAGGWGLGSGLVVCLFGDWWLEARGQGLGWLVGSGWASWLDACLLAWLAGSWRLVAGDWPGW